MVNTIGLKQQRRKTHLSKLAVSHHLSCLGYCTQPFQQVLRPETCHYRRLRFWYCCWDHIVEYFSQVCAYNWIQVCDILCPFLKKNVRYIGKYAVYYNTVLCLVSSFTILILQIFQSYLVHHLIGTYYLNFTIFQYFYFYFWNRIPQHLLIFMKKN